MQLEHSQIAILLAEHAVDISPSLVVDIPADISISSGQAEVIKVKVRPGTIDSIFFPLLVSTKKRYPDLEAFCHQRSFL